MSLRARLCEWLGHRWVGAEIEYEYSPPAPRPGGLGVTWWSSERCSRCGERQWWPA